MLNSITQDKSKYYNQLDSVNKRYEKPIEIKVFKVTEFNEKKLIKYLSPKYYSVFKCEQDGVEKYIEESDLIK